jgi:hypothetical protein
LRPRLAFIHKDVLIVIFMIIACVTLPLSTQADSPIDYNDPNLASNQIDVSFAAAACTKEKVDSHAFENCLRTQGLSDTNDIKRALNQSHLSTSESR